MSWNWPWSKPESKPAKALGVFSTDLPLHTEDPNWRAEQLLKTFQKPFPKPRSGGRAAGMDTQGMDASVKQVMTAGQWGVPDAQLGFFAGQGFIGYQIMALLAQNWLIAKACWMPAKDAVRNGYEVTVNDGTKVSADALDAIARIDSRMKIDKQLKEFVGWSRVFGIRVAMFKVRFANKVAAAKYYEAPYNPDGVTKGSYEGIVQIDPYWMAPQLSNPGAADPTSMHFYEPEWWIINGIKVHRSHLIISIPNPVADVLKPSYYFGGVSVAQNIFERVYAAERTANEAPLLAETKRTTVLHVDVTEALANLEDFTKRMQEWTALRNNFGVKVIGEQEVIEQFDTALADLDVTIMTQFQLVSAAACVPATKLMGTQPKGFNSTGEYEEASYHEMLESIQEDDLTPLLNRHHEMVIRSEIVGSYGVTKPFGTSISWQSLDTPTAKEVADTNLVKAQTDLALIQGGGIGPDESRKRLINDPDSGYNGLEEALPEDPSEGIEQPLEGAEQAPTPDPMKVVDPRVKPDASPVGKPVAADGKRKPKRK